MKVLAFFLALILLLAPITVCAEDILEIDEILNSLDMGALELQYNKEAESLVPITGGLSLEDFVSQLAGGQLFLEYNSIFDYLVGLFAKSLKESLPFVVEILVITLLFSLLSVFYPDFGGTYAAAHYARYILISGIAISVFLRTFTMGNDAIEMITGFSTQFFPLLFFLLTSIGGIASASILKPATAALTGFVSMFVKSFIAPLLVLMCAVTVLASFAKTFKLNNLRELIKSIIKWAIGISFVVFLGCIALQGLMSSTFDGVTIKAAKYTIDKAVPIIGGVFSETMDMLIASSLIIKNAIGVVGMLVIVSMLLSPVITITVQYFLLKLASALSEPLGSGDIAKFLKSMSEIILLQNAVLLTSGAMLLINVGLILGSGNINLMFR